MMRLSYSDFLLSPSVLDLASDSLRMSIFSTSFWISFGSSLRSDLLSLDLRLFFSADGDYIILYLIKKYASVRGWAALFPVLLGVVW